jgi:hypothetical protein
VDEVCACGTILDVPRLLLALLVAAGLCVPASAQVWKLKKAKTGTTAKAPTKKAKAKPTARTIKKKKRSATKTTRKVDLVPDETESTDSETQPDRERVPNESDEPIIIQVEEID